MGTAPCSQLVYRAVQSSHPLQSGKTELSTVYVTVVTLVFSTMLYFIVGCLLSILNKNAPLAKTSREVC